MDPKHKEAFHGGFSYATPSEHSADQVDLLNQFIQLYNEGCSGLSPILLQAGRIGLQYVSSRSRTNHSRANAVSHLATAVSVQTKSLNRLFRTTAAVELLKSPDMDFVGIPWTVLREFSGCVKRSKDRITFVIKANEQELKTLLQAVVTDKLTHHEVRKRMKLFHVGEGRSTSAESLLESPKRGKGSVYLNHPLSDKVFIQCGNTRDVTEMLVEVVKNTEQPEQVRLRLIETLSGMSFVKKPPPPGFTG